MRDEVLAVCKGGGVWINAEPTTEDVAAFFLFGDPFLYNIHIDDEADIPFVYWMTIFRVAHKVAGRPDVHFEIFPPFIGDTDIHLVAVDGSSGKCLTYDPSCGAVSERFEMQEFDYEEFREFIKRIARIFAGGE